MASEPLPRRDGAVLVLAGRLDRAGAPALWKQALPLLDGARGLDLSAVTGVDSAGLALVAELCARLGGSGPAVVPTGMPPELDELRRAYRLGTDLGFQASDEGISP